MSEAEKGQVSSVWWEPPDIVVWEFIGEVDAKVMNDLYSEQARLSLGKPHVLVLVHLERAGKVTTEARHEAARKRDTMNVRGIAYVGASFHLRVLATLVTKAATMLHRASDNPMRFMKTKAEALAWFAERRREIAASSKG